MPRLLCLQTIPDADDGMLMCKDMHKIIAPMSEAQLVALIDHGHGSCPQKTFGHVVNPEAMSLLVLSRTGFPLAEGALCEALRVLGVRLYELVRVADVEAQLADEGATDLIAAVVQAAESGTVPCICCKRAATHLRGHPDISLDNPTQPGWVWLPACWRSRCCTRCARM